MNRRKKGIEAYTREKGKGKNHDLDFNGEKDVPFLPEKIPNLKVKKEEEAAEEILHKEKGSEGLKKAAKFLLYIGKDHAAEVLKHLSPDEIEGITREITQIHALTKKEGEALLKEFGLKLKQPSLNQGGMATAQEMLKGAFGEKKSEEILRKAVPHGGSRPFEFLNDLEFHQILQLVKHEPAPVMAVILPHLESSLSSKILEALTPEKQKDVVLRLARMDKIDTDVLIRMEDALKDKIRKQGKVITEEVDGKTVLADILKHMALTEEEKIIDELESMDPELSRDIKSRLFSLDSVLKIHDKDLQKALRDFDERELAYVLKGKDLNFKEKILSNISERRRTLIEEEMEYLGPVKKSDVDKSTNDFLQYLRIMAEEGKIVLKRENDYYIE